MKARDIMTDDVITVTADTSIDAIAKILHAHRISGVPVVDGEHRVIGIVTEGDLIIKLARPETPPHIEILGGIIYLKKITEIDAELKKITAVTARDIMTEKVVTVEEDCSVEDVASLMVNRKVNRLPVVRKGKLVGIVTRADLIETMMSEPSPDDAHIPDVT
jgi:CBS domain-containing protein